jgi:hypothetical protein
MEAVKNIECREQQNIITDMESVVIKTVKCFYSCRRDPFMYFCIELGVTADVSGIYMLPVLI